MRATGPQLAIRWHLHAILAITVLIGCCLAVTAAEDTASKPSTNATATESSISAAKREFETMKAVRDPAQQQKGALPSMAVPEMHTGGPATPLGSTKTKVDPAGKKSANWLVEAMEKDSRDRRARERADGSERSRASDRGKESIADGANSDLEEPGTENSLRETTAARDEPERREIEKKEIINPLTQFLGQWMTPRDYATLKPAIDESLSARAPFESRGAPSIGVGLPSTSGIPGTEILNGPAVNPAGALAAPRENPYLQILQAPPVPPQNPTVFAPPPTMPAPVSGSSGMITPPPPAVPPKPQIPDFAKPVQDEKYFKQLKRF